MSDPTYHCPVCGSDRVHSSHEQAFMVNTGEHYCHMFKTQDPETNAGCLECDWRGQRFQLKEQTE